MSSIMNLIAQKKNLITEIILFMYSFSLALPIYNAFNSVVTGLTLLLLLGFYRRELFVRLFEIPKLIYGAFFIFIFSILVASFGINDIKSINKGFNIIYWMLPFFLMYLVASFEKNKYAVCYAFHLALLVSNIVVIYEYIDTHRRITGIYNQPNHFGTMLDVLLPFCFCYAWQYYKENKSRMFSSLLLINAVWGFLTLFLTASRGALIGVFIGGYVCLFTYGFRKMPWKKMLIVCTLITCIFGYIGYSNTQQFSRSYDYERILLLKSSYNMWEDNKVFGIGLANWKEYYQKKYILPEAKERKLDMPHNIFAYYFSTTGLVGGIAFVVLTLSIILYLIINSAYVTIKNVLCYAMLWAMIAITVHGLVDTGITMKYAARIFYACLGLTVSKINYFNNFGVKGC